jgi:hypothetical protein
MADLKRINGNDVSWASIIAKIDDEPYYGFNSLSYGDKRTREYSYGMGRHHAPRSKSAGKYEPEPCVLKGPKSSVQALRQALQAKADGFGISSYGDIVFNVVAQYIEGLQDHTDEILECTVASIKDSHDEGTGVLQQEIELMPMFIIRDGTTLFDRSST